MAERVNEGVLSLSERLIDRYNHTQGVTIVGARSERRINGQTGHTDILTTISLAPDYETTNMYGLATPLLEGFNRLPRYDRGYEEGRLHETDEHGRTIVSVQVFPYSGAVPEMKPAAKKVSVQEPEYYI